MDEKLLTVSQACAYLNISKSTLYVLLSKRRVGKVKIEGAVRIWKRDIDAYLQAQYSPPRERRSVRASEDKATVRRALDTLRARKLKTTYLPRRMTGSGAAGK